MGHEQFQVQDEEKQAMRVWWIPQVPCQPFHVQVDDPAEAIKILRILAAYDTFQYEHNIKPDYANVGGLEFYDDRYGWCEWGDELGDDINQIMRR